MNNLHNENKEQEKTKSGFRLLKLIAIAAVVFAVLAIISFPLKTVHYDFYSDEISEGMRIAQISDLHSCAYGKDMKNLIEALDAEEPDIVVLTGDIYDERVDNGNTRTLLKDIGRRYPCYYVAGNHEFRAAEWSEWKLEAESFGIEVLEGENITAGDITICGAAKAADGSITWDESVARCAEAADGCCVLLWHFPEEVDMCRSYGIFDLILSGHAHGGHWRIPFILNGLFSPGEGLFPKYAGGRYDFEDSTMIVSRGLDRTKNVIPRIFNNPELVIIDMIPADDREQS